MNPFKRDATTGVASPGVPALNAPWMPGMTCCRTLVARQGLPVTPLGQHNTSGFDAALSDLASSSGTAISWSTTKMMDYPTRPAAQANASPAVRAPLLLALAIIVAAAVGMTPTLIRVLHRRHRNRPTT